MKTKYDVLVAENKWRRAKTVDFADDGQCRYELLNGTVGTVGPDGWRKAVVKTLGAESYTSDEARRLLAACSRRASTGIRNRAIIAVLWRAGLRISAALNLFLKDMDFEAGSIRVLNGKGGKSRVVGIDDDALVLVSAWLKKRQGLGLNGDHRLFCTLAGNPLSSAYMRQLLPRLAAKAGVEKRVHPHGFRHTHATELLREGNHIGIISKQLGHSSTATTAAYLDHICPQEVVDAMRGRRWDGKGKNAGE